MSDDGQGFSLPQTTYAPVITVAWLFLPFCGNRIMLYAKELLNTFMVTSRKHITYQCGEMSVTEFRCYLMMLLVCYYMMDEQKGRNTGRDLTESHIGHSKILFSVRVQAGVSFLLHFPCLSVSGREAWYKWCLQLLVWSFRKEIFIEICCYH